MDETRLQILQSLRLKGLSAEELAGKMGLSYTGIRQHLLILERDRLIEKRPKRVGTGRPKYIYHLTEEAETFFPKQYSMLINSLMEYLIEQMGKKDVGKIIKEIAERNAAKYQDRFSGLELEGRVELLLDLLNEMGAYASVEKKGDEYILQGCNCAFYDTVKNVGSVICVFDSSFMSYLLGDGVEIESSHSKDSCTFHIRSNLSS